MSDSKPLPDPFVVHRLTERIRRTLADQDRAAQRAADMARASEHAAAINDAHARDRAEYQRLRAINPFEAAAFAASRPHVHDSPDPPLEAA